MNFSQRIALTNSAQGEYKKVLCVCSANCLRSPSAAIVLANPPFNFNTRSAGLDTGLAVVPVTETLIEWADEIVCMDIDHENKLRKMTDKPIIRMDIPDVYNYRDPELMRIIAERYPKIADHIPDAGKKVGP